MSAHEVDMMMLALQWELGIAAGWPVADRLVWVLQLETVAESQP